MASWGLFQIEVIASSHLLEPKRSEAKTHRKMKVNEPGTIPNLVLMLSHAMI